MHHPVSVRVAIMVSLQGEGAALSSQLDLQINFPWCRRRVSWQDIRSKTEEQRISRNQELHTRGVVKRWSINNHMVP